MDSTNDARQAGAIASPVCHLYRLGTVAYTTAWQWQKARFDALRKEPQLEDTLFLLEHPPVYTLGQGADHRFLKFDPHPHLPPVVKVERGGEVTYHCPGQLVGYPILNLRRYRPDLHWYLRQLEEVVIRTLALFQIPGERIEGLTGVWVEGYKVAAIGIKVSRWITMHGFALNVNPDLSGFSRIVPCGIDDKPVGSLAQFKSGITQADVQFSLEAQFAQVFACQLISQSASGSGYG